MFGGKRIQTTTIIAEGSVLSGNLETQGDVHVDGTVEGTVAVEGNVSVGPKGKVHGELRGINVTVAGRVDGELVVQEHLHVLSTGRCTQDVTYGTLQVDKGGALQGMSRPTEVQDSEPVKGADSATKLLESVPPASMGQA